MKDEINLEQYFAKSSRQQELSILRDILLSCGLEETVKWGAPTYTFAGKNVASLASFKSYVGLWFYQGALLEDKKMKLINAQEGKTKALRQWRFTSMETIESKTIKAYVKEAIQNAKLGKSIKPTIKKRTAIPNELSAAFRKSPELKKSFSALSRAKQNEYAEYLLEAVKTETKLKRLEKIIPLIIRGEGLNDRYRH